MRNCKRRQNECFMGCIDNKKTYNMALLSWVTKALGMFQLKSNVNAFIGYKNKTSSQWMSLTTVKVKSDIFQGDILSPILFVIALIPLSLSLQKMKVRYSLGKGLATVNHLHL